MPLIQVIVSQVMNLKPQLIDSSKDEEDVKAIARLFANIGDSYVELIATGMILDLLIIVNLQMIANLERIKMMLEKTGLTFSFSSWVATAEELLENLQFGCRSRDDLSRST
ncbi:putative armadillo-like helical protein [Helianthus anomalus]